MPSKAYNYRITNARTMKTLSPGVPHEGSRQTCSGSFWDAVDRAARRLDMSSARVAYVACVLLEEITVKLTECRMVHLPIIGTLSIEFVRHSHRRTTGGYNVPMLLPSATFMRYTHDRMPNKPLPTMYHPLEIFKAQIAKAYGKMHDQFGPPPELHDDFDRLLRLFVNNAARDGADPLDDVSASLPERKSHEPERPPSRVANVQVARKAKRVIAPPILRGRGGANR